MCEGSLRCFVMKDLCIAIVLSRSWGIFINGWAQLLQQVFLAS